MKIMQKFLDKIMFKKLTKKRIKKEADAIYKIYWDIGEYELAESHYKAYMDLIDRIEEPK